MMSSIKINVIKKIVTRYSVDFLDFFFPFTGNVEDLETKIFFDKQAWRAVIFRKRPNTKIYLLKI